MPPNNLHHHILDNLKTAILLVEPNLTVSYINPAAESLLAVSDQRIHGEAITKLFHEDEDTLVKLLDAINKREAYTKRETVLTLRSGREITVDYAVTPVIEHPRTSLIIELQPLDRLLRISREEGLLSSQQNSQALIRGIAHEVKNPLGGLRGAAQLLARELDEPRLHDYTNIIIEEADRLRNLVDNMLGPHKVPEKCATNIHEVLERVRQLIDVESQGRLQIIRDYDPSIPDIFGDREQLIQAFLNIMRNAQQALLESTHHSDPIITLRSRTLRQFTIGSHRHRLVCRVDIIDNGPGIPSELLPSIFLPMISGRADGSGLGLSIAQSILNHHRGLIECQSEPGCTQFSLFIPVELKQ
ncbi:nitrogen regulation protein NR(II) [Spongiibacter sp. KMU-166]|uniref:Sensory histidine kinase/phosphatase NtrB n=1 Tax=Spongiibacter thalassae TaxID=2721624 RepID=A0ABX1GJ07_9GAMM|nr:nitrogen regulation protein NR(II) [Spongiibacter thalassae]NKI19219.1 nitrogen regulation protein NR(II) [Spongiibacter thalassae]